MKRELMNQADKIVLEVLYRSFRVLYRKDSRVRREIDSWAEDLTLKLVRHDEKHGIVKLRRAQKADITMRFKSVEGAFQVLSGQKSVADAYAEHLFFLEGDIFQTMSFVRCVEYLEGYLFPEFMSRRILKELPGRQVPALQVYALALLENGN